MAWSKTTLSSLGQVVVDVISIHQGKNRIVRLFCERHNLTTHVFHPGNTDSVNCNHGMKYRRQGSNPDKTVEMPFFFLASAGVAGIMQEYGTGRVDGRGGLCSGGLFEEHSLAVNISA